MLRGSDDGSRKLTLSQLWDRGDLAGACIHRLRGLLILPNFFFFLQYSTEKFVRSRGLQRAWGDLDKTLAKAKRQDGRAEVQKERIRGDGHFERGQAIKETKEKAENRSRRTTRRRRARLPGGQSWRLRLGTLGRRRGGRRTMVLLLRRG